MTAEARIWGRDPFGATVRERLLRRAAGGSAATALLVGVGVLAEAPLGLLLLICAAGGSCTALSWWLERLRPSLLPLLRYALLGALAGALAAIVALRGQLDYVVVALFYAVPPGGAGGLLAAAVARYLPGRALVPLTVVCTIAIAIAVAVAVA